MTYTGSIEDRIAIRELLETYNDAVFRRDQEAWTSTWAEDAEWVLLGNSITGRDNIVQAWLGAMGTFSYVGFFASPGSIVVSGDTAQTRVYVRETLIETSGNKRNLEGLYEDTCVCADGKWLFSRRNYQILQEL